MEHYPLKNVTVLCGGQDLFRSYPTTRMSYEVDLYGLKTILMLQILLRTTYYCSEHWVSRIF